MLIELFRSNNPLAILLYVLFILLVRVVLLFNYPDVGETLRYHEPLTKSLFEWLRNWPFRFDHLQIVLGALIQLIQAIHLNYILSQYRVLPKRNYVGGFVFLCFTSFFPEFFFPGPALISLSLFIWMSGLLFSIFKSDKPYATLFNIGTLAALCILLYFPNVIFLIYLMVGLLVMRPFILREWVMMLLGLIAPFYVAFSWYYLNETSPDWSPIALPEHWLATIPALDLEHIVVISAYALLTGISVMFLPAALFGGLIQVRKFASMMFTFLVLVLLSYFLRPEFTVTHLVLLSLPLSVQISLLMENTRSNLLPDAFVLLLLFIIAASQYLHRLVVL